MKKLIYLILFSVIILVSCKEEADQIPPGFQWDCDYFIGSFELLPSSYIALQAYSGHKNVVFEDSLGNEAIFSITTEEKIHEESLSSISSNLNEYNHTSYCYYQDSKTTTLINDSLDISIILRLAASPESFTPKENIVADQLIINVLHQEGSHHVNLSNFIKTINQRTSPTFYEVTYVDSLSCFGKVFYNVENRINPFLHVSYNLYFNETEGVVLFNDANNKRWRFERFE